MISAEAASTMYLVTDVAFILTVHKAVIGRLKSIGWDVLLHAKIMFALFFVIPIVALMFSTEVFTFVLVISRIYWVLLMCYPGKQAPSDEGIAGGNHG